MDDRYKWFTYFSDCHDEAFLGGSLFPLDRDPRFYEEDRAVFGKDLIISPSCDLPWFQIVKWGEDRWEPGLRRKQRVDKGSVFHFLYGGKCTVNGRPVSSGQVFMTSSLVPYDMEGDPDDPPRYYWIQHKSGSDLLPRNGTVRWEQDVAFFDFSHCYEEVCRLLRKGLFLSGDFFYIAYGLNGLMYEIFSRISTAKGSRRDERSPYVRRALDYIHRHYSEDISVNSIADELFISRTHLRRLFLRDLGITPKEQIAKCRVEAAVALMGTAPELSMTRLAAAVGYPSYSQFIQAFRKIYGCTPGEYRAEAGN